jgi:hypothetical protein
LLAEGRFQREVAEEIGVSAKTISRWSDREDFRALIREYREQLVSGVSVAENVLLTAATSASRSDGSPDWPSRVAAAKALLSAPVASEPAKEQVRETTIYLAPGETA